MGRGPASEIDRTAAEWAARFDRGLAPEEALELDAWLAGDVRRSGAYGKARAVALHTERARALAPNFDPADFSAAAEPAALSRRRLLAVGGGAIAAGLAAAVTVGVNLRGRGRTYSTQRGEVKVVSLSDGSVISLNTASRMAVSFTRERREVRLMDGEALFDVAKDRSRPFLVEAGEVQVRAVGTSFTVRRIAGAPVQVLVREGVVEVRRHDAVASVAPVRAAANTEVIAASARQPIAASPLAPSELNRQLAWREGRVAFEGASLQQAANEFARYSDIRLVIDDPTIAGEEITGLYQANDPVGFAQAVAVALDLHAKVGEREVRLTR
jgi:transmembrane sensor